MKLSDGGMRAATMPNDEQGFLVQQEIVSWYVVQQSV